MAAYQQFTIRCACGNLTSKAFARTHDGKCKACFTGVPREVKSSPGDWRTEHKRKTGRCEDAPCCGCCGPQGDGDYYGRDAAEAAMDGGY